MSMLDVAPDAALTSATNVWSAYYKELFSDVLNGKEIPQDWSKGFNDDAVAITDLGPVSYTHLDVYKRQVFLQSDHVDGDNRNIRITGFDQRTADEADAVSYTHLDVYKRQVYRMINTLEDIGAISRKNMYKISV